jgi:hypothetical protein
MATCPHEHLQLEETAAHYRCATCGLQFVVLRVEAPPDVPGVAVGSAPEGSLASSEGLDLPEHIGRFLPAQRRLPSSIKR